ncbi:uncharacterized protein LOC122559942 [Chiloscyllium plagiosum]|uniref:uncharacterized protein LOC122559942 n=1 Tax=Chiloscyllium plagiosum TaxID=36176 RepID=UPI001CB8771C|nr:uncharacterized protein LOC122559942 [Chiloscyllium plagiosum]
MSRLTVFTAPSKCEQNVTPIIFESDSVPNEQQLRDFRSEKTITVSDWSQGTQSVLGEAAGIGQGTQSVLGGAAGIGQGSQSVLGEAAGIGQGTQSVLGGAAGIGQGTQSVLGEAAGIRQGTQSVLGGAAGLGQGTQSVMGEAAGIGQGTQSVLGGSAGIGQGSQCVLGGAAGIGQGTQSVVGGAAGIGQGTQPVMGEAAGIGQGTQSVLGEAAGIGQGTQSVLGEGAGFQQDTQSFCSSKSGLETQVQFGTDRLGKGSEEAGLPVLSNGRGSEETEQQSLHLTPSARIGSVVDLNVKPEQSELVVGTAFQVKLDTRSAVYRGSKSKQFVRPTVFRDVRSAQYFQSLLPWDKRSEQCLHLPLAGNWSSKQLRQPLKCQDVGLEPWAQPVLAENTGLARQIFITLTRNLSYISGLYDSVQLDGFSTLHGQHSSPDGSHLNPGKKDSPSRATVWKQGKSCPGAPKKKAERKNGHVQVHFADSVGLQLTEIHSFDATVEPTVPEYVLANLHSTPPTAQLAWVQSFKKEFTNPKDDVNFDERVSRQKVCLETVMESDLVISGTILVLNLAYHKEVTVRYTCTDWNLFTDVPAFFENSIEDKKDRFAFILNLSFHILKPGSSVQFAIKYTANGVEFWDNNDSNNYTLTYQPFQVMIPNNNSSNSLVNSD